MPDRVQLEGLRIQAGDTTLVHDAELLLASGKLTALVGPSGSGKSLTARSLLGLVDLHPGVVAGRLQITTADGQIHLPYAGCLGAGRRARDVAFRPVRGHLIGYLAQDARAALDPLFRVGRQVATAAALGGRSPDPRPWLQRAGFRRPDELVGLWPHQLSGGMAQRVAIAQCLARGSRFILADEPTSALDPTIQHNILRELRALADTGIGVLLITHDLRILPDFADEVVVMDHGRMVERLTPQVLRGGSPSSEVARSLVAATRRIAGGSLGGSP